MNKEEISELIRSIGQPEVYDTDWNIIKEKTLEIKKLQNKFELSFSEIRNLYHLNMDILKKVIIELMK